MLTFESKFAIDKLADRAAREGKIPSVVRYERLAALDSAPTLISTDGYALAAVPCEISPEADSPMCFAASAIKAARRTAGKRKRVEVAVEGNTTDDEYPPADQVFKAAIETPKLLAVKLDAQLLCDLAAALGAGQGRNKPVTLYLPLPDEETHYVERPILVVATNKDAEAVGVVMPLRAPDPGDPTSPVVQRLGRGAVPEGVGGKDQVREVGADASQAQVANFGAAIVLLRAAVEWYDKRTARRILTLPGSRMLDREAERIEGKARRFEEAAEWVLSVLEEMKEEEANER